MSVQRLLCYEPRDTARERSQRERNQRWLTLVLVLLLCAGVVLLIWEVLR